MTGSLSVTVSKKSCFPNYTVQILGSSANNLGTNLEKPSTTVLIAQVVSRGSTSKIVFPNVDKATVRVLVGDIVFSEDVWENPTMVNSEIKLGECPPCKLDGDCKTWAPHCVAGKCNPLAGMRCTKGIDCPTGQRCGEDGKCVIDKSSSKSSFLGTIGFILLMFAILALGVYLFKKFIVPLLAKKSEKLKTSSSSLASSTSSSVPPSRASSSL